jgi:glucosylceramidase
LKHLSHFVNPGARRLDTFTLTGCENLLAFVNPDESVVVLIQNDLCEELPVRIKIGEKVIRATLGSGFVQYICGSEVKHT